MSSALNSAKLQATTLPVTMLDIRTRERLFQLYAAHYEAVDETIFREDLAEKHWIVLVHDDNQTVQGFSTLKVFPFRCPAEQPIQILFSGDTVINPRHWGSPALAFEWIRCAGALKAKKPMISLYWLLISKGHRTYRYLSAFSHEYWPRFDAPTPMAVKRMLDDLARERFGRCYDPATGIVSFPQSRGQLIPELANVPPEDLGRPEVAFFLQTNPGYRRGDELVCLTELSPDNLRPLARRLFLKGQRTSPAHGSDKNYGQNPVGRVT